MTLPISTSPPAAGYLWSVRRHIHAQSHVAKSNGAKANWRPRRCPEPRTSFTANAHLGNKIRETLLVTEPVSSQTTRRVLGVMRWAIVRIQGTKNAW